MKFIFFFSVIFLQVQDYRKVSLADAYKEFGISGSDIIRKGYQLKNSFANVYIHNNGEVLLTPNNLVRDYTCLIFKDEKTFEYYHLKDSFPIENNVRAPEEQFQDEIRSLPERLPELKKYLVEVLNMDSVDLEVAKILASAQSYIEANRADEKVYFYASLLLGDEIRKKNNARWIILKRYGDFNPYWVPALVKNNNDIILVMERVVFYWLHHGVPLEQFLSSELSRVSHLKLNRKGFKYAFSDYKKL